MSKWIDVKNRLPEEGIMVETYSVKLANYTGIMSLEEDGKWYDELTGEEVEDNPTHWFPVPKLPKPPTA